MNCREFDELVDCLARDQMMEAGLKAVAQGHLAGCQTCRTGFEDQRKLTAALRALAAETANAGASAACEQTLMNLFDESGVRAVRRPARARWIYAASAAAAVALVIAGASYLGSIGTPSRFAPIAAFNIGIDSNAIPLPEVVRTLAVRESARRSTRQSSTRRPRNVPEEVATDFIAVSYGDQGFEAGSQVVRIEVPRSTLASFGLPVNMDRVDQSVKADVLVGMDGVARAIRFVQ